MKDLNTFVQYLTEQEWDHDYPSRRGPAYRITDYMKGEKSKIMPIMTNSESLLQFGNNAYGKPATAMNILRETVMGRELFDFAFKEYCERWAFKHPTPADLFRTMEDASGVDLDWFWRGWFYTNDHVDVAINSVKWYEMSSMDPEAEYDYKTERSEQYKKHIGYERNQEIETVVEKDETMKDFYNSYDPAAPTERLKQQYQSMMEGLTDDQKAMLNSGLQFYEIEFENIGGLVMPIILKFEFADGTDEVVRIPAEIWLRNEDKFSKVFTFEKEVVAIEMDPFLEMADTDRNNNFWPAKQEPTRFEMFKQKQWRSQSNPMQSR